MARRPFEVNSVLSPFSGFIGAVCGSAMIGSLAFALAFIGLSFRFEMGIFVAAFTAFVLAFICSIVIVPIVALFIGVPFTCLLAVLRWENAVTYTLGGAVLGWIPLAGASGDWELMITGSFGIYGGTCGLLWWLLYRRACQPLPEDLPERAEPSA